MIRAIPNMPSGCHSITPFDERLIDFCALLSKNLFALSGSKNHPELAALAFWLRKSNILKLRDRFLSQQKILVPRGLVFHIPPSNVETMFVYSWIPALLTGNANIVRLPSRRSEISGLLLKTIAANLEEDLAKRNLFFSYDHEEAITAKLSRQADVRVIWGGDTTVQKIRPIPLKPTGKDIIFPDRFSFAVINGRVYQKLRRDEKRKLALNFFSDFTLFDQNACSSPKALFWLGDMDCSAEFDDLLFSVIKEKQHRVPLGGVLLKNNQVYKHAAKLNLLNVRVPGNELISLTLADFDDDIRKHPGFGLLYHIFIHSFDDLLKAINKKDQTMLYFGFDKTELFSFIKKVNGRGIDRIAPIGQALNFNNIWDGMDLLLEFTKIATII